MSGATLNRPAAVISIQRMVCTGCGAEANASCNCGKPYLPKLQQAEKVARENPGISVRDLAEKADVSHATVYQMIHL
jgi:hypothetical protein